MIPRRCCAKSRRSIGQLIAVLMLQAVAGYVGRAQDPSVNSNPPVTTAQGSKTVKPAAGTGGAGTTYNFLPYITPGEFFNSKTNVIETAPFDITYATRNQPIQTSDWWTASASSGATTTRRPAGCSGGRTVRARSAGRRLHRRAFPDAVP